MNRQDLSGVRTAQDLERKYNLTEVKENIELIKKNTSNIESLNQDLQSFTESVTRDLGELQDQVDGNITTWFHSGVPTISNYPANEWTTTEERNSHLGDLYYDQDTGYSYRFTMLNSVFQWVKLTDSDITEALAVANAAKDTADKKRRVFLEQPTPPYDNGDMWVKDKEIWICQISRAEGTYQTGDFINDLKYTDDTYAKGVNDDLTIVKGTVTQTRSDVDNLQQTMTSTVELVNSQGEKIGTLETKQSEITQNVDGISSTVSQVNAKVENNYQDITSKLDDFATKENVQLLESSVNNLQTSTYTKTEINTKLTDGSVTKVQTTSGTFDENGMHYEKTNAKTKATINEVGVEVDSTISNEELLFAGYDENLHQTIVRTENLTVRRYFVIGENSRIEDYEGGGGIFTL